MYAIRTTEEILQSPNPFIEPPFTFSPLANARSIPSSAPATYLPSPTDQTSPETLTGSSAIAQSAPQPFTHSEAVLVRNFVSKVALWSDATDPARSFEIELPRRALTEPLLKHAICAFSSRHFYRHVKDHHQQAEALDHQNRCLELLIPAMSGGQGINESMLTAVAILRQNEEMDG
jgi:hypothetical protein